MPGDKEPVKQGGWTRKGITPVTEGRDIGLHRVILRRKVIGCFTRGLEQGHQQLEPVIFGDLWS